MGKWPFPKRSTVYRQYTLYGIGYPAKRTISLPINHEFLRTYLGGSASYCARFFFVLFLEHVVVMNPCVFVLVKLSTFMINRNSTRTYHVAWGDSCEFVEPLDHFCGGKPVQRNQRWKNSMSH